MGQRGPLSAPRTFLFFPFFLFYFYSTLNEVFLALNVARETYSRRFINVQLTL